MTPALQDELKQTKPFRPLQEEEQMNVVRTDTHMSDAFEQMLKPRGITGTQYNVLRILRGAEPDGLCRNEVSQRLLNRMPDATQLLDRMEEAGLVTRERSTVDRRLVTTRITKKGRQIVDSLDDSADGQHERSLGHMNEQQLRTLIKLLTVARNTE